MNKELSTIAARTLSENLKHLGLNATAKGNSAYLAESPTIEITVKHITQQSHIATVILHFEITFALNSAIPESFVHTCCTGWGKSDNEALDNALEIWQQAVAVPILSVLYKQPRFGAEWFPEEDELGLSGWDYFASPYLFRGEDDGYIKFLSEIEAQPLLLPIRTILAQALDKKRHFHYVSLFVAEVNGKREAEVFIGEQKREDIAEMLLQGFPVTESIRFGSVRQGLFCLRAIRGNNP